MPELSVELWLLLALLETFRANLDNPGECREFLIGRMRRLLGPTRAANVVPITGAAITPTHAAAQCALASICKMCKGCDLADE